MRDFISYAESLISSKIKDVVDGEIFSSAPGTVDFIAFDPYGGGTLVEINHHVDNLGTNYIHLSKVSISVGQVVSRGTILGLSGPSPLPGQNDLYQATHFDIIYYEQSGEDFFDPYRAFKAGDPKFSGFVGKPGYWFSPWNDYRHYWNLSSPSDMRNLVTYRTKDDDPQYPAA